jgi:hypothetical protein
MVSDAKKKKAASKALRSRAGGSAKSGDSGPASAVGSSAALDKLGSLRLTDDGEAADAADRAVTCVLSSHPQV